MAEAILKADAVVVRRGFAQDAHSGKPIGVLEHPVIGRLLDLRPPKRSSTTIHVRQSAPTGPISPFHESVDIVIEVLVGPANLKGRFLNGKLLSYSNHPSPLELLAAQSDE